MAIMDVAIVGFTRADLDALPDDGRRHELIDGAFFVTPSPGLLHQDVVARLWRLLEPLAARDGFHVVIAPFDVALAEHTVVVPDLVVARRSSFTDRDLSTAPVLVVEVRSPSTARVDQLVKREVYERAGVASYWLVDPLTPAVTVLELAAGTYAERGRVTGDQTLEVTQPFPAALKPSSWLSHAPS
jgi:Uma2 family endonuclease